MTSANPSRKPGRPAGVAASADRREALLDAAEDLFGAQGFAATSVRQIADRADSNPALVHYYFGNKQELLGAVMDRLLEPLAAAIGTLRGKPGQSLENVVPLFMQTLAKHPALPQLIVREVLLPGGDLQDYFIRNYAPRIGGALPEIIAAQQDSGAVRADLDPSLVALQVMAMCVFPFLARPLAESVLKVDYSERGIHKLTRHMLETLHQGIRS